MERKIEVVAKRDNWGKVLNFLDTFIKQIKLTGKMKNDICLACEEIYVNIASYAYPDKEGLVSVELSTDELKNHITVQFEDRGIEFDPLKIALPKISGSADERKIGGLGIFMVRKLMDNMEYRYENGKNKLKLVKKIEVK